MTDLGLALSFLLIMIGVMIGILLGLWIAERMFFYDRRKDD